MRFPSAGERLSGPRDALREALEHAIHLLPAQNPLGRFVHHDPLHAFEHLPFDEAVVEASAIFGTEPYLAEAEYREAFARGRIHLRDLVEVVRAEVPDGPVAGIVDRHALARAVLLHPIAPLAGERLQWALAETDALRLPRADLTPEARAGVLSEAGGDPERAMRRLWAACEDRRAALPSPPAPPAPPDVRVRDRLVRRLGVDPDPIVDGLLIRWCAAYLDQGVAYWPMDGREVGFYGCFVAHFATWADPGRPWGAALRGLVRRARAEGWSAEDLAIHCLGALGHPEATWTEVVTATLLALRGWAGMFQRLAARPDLAPELRLPATVADVLAVRLALDLVVGGSLLPDLPSGDTAIERLDAVAEPPPPAPTEDPAWTLFQVAQILGLGPHTVEQLATPRLATLLAEVWALPSLARRRIWHLAFERRHRVEILDAITVHGRRAPRAAAAPRAQCVFCFDDREESLRRHLEEVAPWAATYGAAGNFGIAMYYADLAHGRPVALGPAGAAPRHLVVERSRSVPARGGRLQGLVRHHLDVGSQTLLRGSLVALGGWIAALPMSSRLLAPRLHAALTRRQSDDDTELEVDRVTDVPDASGLLRGFTLDEQVAIVRGMLETIGLVRGFAPLVLVLGHGSTATNNPHQAAYDCGACGGGRGGPNARVFAWMANDPRVRARLREVGVDVPDGTWFVGGWHDTTRDAITLYDRRRVPDALGPALDALVAALDEARVRDAHERARKFHDAPLELDARAALRHVETRAEDMAQPRPEYGHSTNAVALVGRRAWSRGLFLDRRAFLISYDPATDPDGGVLARLLGVALPVGAGINLEYWFSTVDNARWGAGTKLPHNVTGLLGVMDGHASDLRTGLPHQMIEIHEPVRLLCVVEASPAALLRVAAADPAVGRLVANRWVQLASLDPTTGALTLFQGGSFQPWRPESDRLPIVRRSADWYAGARGLLPAASVLPGGEP